MARHDTRPSPKQDLWTATYLRDPGVRALAVGACQLQPLALVDGAVLPQRTLALELAPATLEVRVRLEAQAAALTHGSALIEVNCRQKARVGWAQAARGGECGKEYSPSLWWCFWTWKASLPLASLAHCSSPRGHLPTLSPCPASHRAVEMVERLWGVGLGQRVGDE